MNKDISLSLLHNGQTLAFLAVENSYRQNRQTCHARRPQRTLKTLNHEKQTIFEKEKES